MKKAISLLMVLALVLGLAACTGGSTEPAAAQTPAQATDAPAATDAPKEEAPKDLVYTYAEDRGDFKIDWKVMLMGDGTFVLQETHGLSGETTNHAGLSFQDNGDGTVTTGAWYNFDMDKSDFFEFDGSCTWKINEDGTCEPLNSGKTAEAGAVKPGKYSYEENRGDFKVTWTIYLNGNGSCKIEETHGLSGETKTYETEGWKDNGNGTVTTEAWTTEGDKSEFFAPNGVCTWKINEDGTCEPAAEGEKEASTGVKPGKYVYEEDRGDFKVTWEVLLMGNGGCRLDETHGLSGEKKSHETEGWKDNGDGTVTTEGWLEQADKSEFFAPNGVCTWKINADGTCEPVKEEKKEASAGSVNPGKYVYEEDRGDFKVTWEVLLMGNGGCRLDETHGLSGEKTAHEAEGWKDNGDGTVTTGAWKENGNKSEFFSEDGSCTWKINADGTCEPVKE